MDLAKKSVDAIRIISAEAINRANSGHPGICKIGRASCRDRVSLCV